MEEEPINKLIDLDNEAKHELKEIEEKEENIEDYINQKLTILELEGHIKSLPGNNYVRC